MDNFDLRKYLAENKLLKEEDDSEDVQNKLSRFIDELAASLSGWYLSYDMKPHDAWSSQIWASSAHGNKIKDKLKNQQGASKEEKLKNFWKISEKHYGMEGKEPDGNKEYDAIEFGKKIRGQANLPDISSIRIALKPGSSQGASQVDSIISSVTGMDPLNFFQSIK